VQGLAVGETLTDVMTVQSFDGTEQAITITITGTNDGPVVMSTAQAGDVYEDGTLAASGQMTVSDADVSDTHTFSDVTGQAGQYGSFSVATDGSWDYALDNANAAVQALGAGETLQETFTIEADDQNGGTVTQDVTITIHGTNDTPVVGNIDLGSTAEDTSVLITQATLLAQSSDGDASDVLSVSAVTVDPAYGSIVDNGNDTWTFTPASDWHGDDVQISFTVTDTHDSVSAVATIDVTAVSDVSPDTGSGSEDQSITINVLSNDTFEGTVTAVEIVTAPVHGSIVAGGTLGEFIYTPDADWHGDEATLTYRVTTDDGLTEEATLDLTVNAVSDVVADAVTTDEDAGTVTVDVLANDGFSGAATVSSASVTSGAGTATVDAGGDVQYDFGTAYDSLGAGDTAEVTIDYVAANGGADETGTLTVTIDGINDTAIIGGDVVGSVTEDVAVDGSGDLVAGGLLTISDVDAGEASFQAGTVVGTYGSLTIDTAGAWSYAADNSQSVVQGLAVGETLTDVMTVQSFDGTEQAITITITGTNDAPVITEPTTDAAYSIDIVENSAIQIAVAASDSDTSDTVMNFALLGHDAGLFEIDDNGVLTFNADAAGFAEYNGVPDYENPADSDQDNQYDVTVRVSDASGACDDLNISISVTDLAQGDIIWGTPEPDTLSGSAAGEVIVPLQSSDIVSAGAGDDTVRSSIEQDASQVDVFLDENVSAEQYSLSANGLTFTYNGGADRGDAIPADHSVLTGKWYWEQTFDDLSGTMDAIQIGIIAPADTDWAGDPFIRNVDDAFVLRGNGKLYEGNGGSASTTSFGFGNFEVGDVIGVALDLDNGNMWISINGEWLGGGDPGTGTAPTVSGLTTGIDYVPIAVGYTLNVGTNHTVTFDFSGGGNVPTGFSQYYGLETPSDFIDGGTGSDWIDFSFEDQAIDMVTTELAVVGETEIEGDRYVNFENISGSQYSDRLNGGDGDNELRGNAGDDILDGGAGDDLLSGGAGDDTITGGAGVDTVVFDGSISDYQVTYHQDGSVTVDDLRVGSPNGTDVVLDGAHLQFDDALTNSAPTAANYAIANASEGSTVTISEADILSHVSDAEGDQLSILSLILNDTTAGALSDNDQDGVWDLVLNSGWSGTLDISYTVSDGYDSSTAVISQIVQVQDKVLNGTSSGDLLEGASGNDFIDGGSGHDTLNGAAGNDSLYGGSGNDLIDGGGDNDIIDPENGNDTIYGGAGDDTIFGARDDNVVDGGDGTDTFDISQRGGSATVNLENGTAVYGTASHSSSLQNIENVIGTDFDDNIVGSAAANVLRGEDESDTLDGADGNDTLDGGAQPDDLIGGAGDDVLTGGNGADDFFFNFGDGNDVITDFGNGADDIDLSATGLAFGDLTIEQVGSDTVISYGTDTITLLGVNVADISQADFVF
ncbi:MAG: cadherin-like domain-containing protein, partial [Alphaproteobacteria bacterium]|nr:cadherin-like domain-containing protein [Alphaproteobacteria bacterium]